LGAVFGITLIGAILGFGFGLVAGHEREGAAAGIAIGFLASLWPALRLFLATLQGAGNVIETRIKAKKKASFEAAAVAAKRDRDVATLTAWLHAWNMQKQIKAAQLLGELGPAAAAAVPTLVRLTRITRRSLNDQSDCRPLNSAARKALEVIDPDEARRAATLGPLSPHRAGGLLVGVVLGTCPCLFVLGPMVWILADKDLKQIAAGKMEPSGEALTRTAKYLAILGTIISVSLLIWWNISQLHR
jgi:hypothetical protein